MLLVLDVLLYDHVFVLILSAWIVMLGEKEVQTSRLWLYIENPGPKQMLSQITMWGPVR